MKILLNYLFKHVNLYLKIFFHNWHMHIVKKIILMKKLKEYSENPNYTYFEENILPLDVYFHMKKHNVQTTNTYHNKQYNSNLR